MKEDFKYLFILNNKGTSQNEMQLLQVLQYVVLAFKVFLAEGGFVDD